MRRFTLLSTTAALVLLSLTLPAIPPAHAQTEIALTIEKDRFTPEEIKVKAGAPFVLVIADKDKTRKSSTCSSPASRR